jgi:hypothetical protein
METRELKAKSDGKVWAYSVKVATMGATFEVTTKEGAIVASLTCGRIYDLTGEFEQFNGQVRLVLRVAKEVVEAEGTPANGGNGASLQGSRPAPSAVVAGR